MWPEPNPTTQDHRLTHLMFTSPNEKPGPRRNDIDGVQLASPKMILQRLHDGDCELFYEMTQGFLPNVYALVRSMVDDASTADDICQQTFLIALQKVHQLRDLHCLRSWVTQIAVNQVRMFWRSSRRHPKVSIDVFADPEIQLLMPATLIDARETPLEAMAHKELSRILELALQQLAPRYRAVFWLRDVEQFSGAETAAILGITINCVKARLLRARLKLRDHLAPALGMEAKSAQLARSTRMGKESVLRDGTCSYFLCCVRT